MPVFSPSFLLKTEMPVESDSGGEDDGNASDGSDQMVDVEDMGRIADTLTKAKQEEAGESGVVLVRNTKKSTKKSPASGTAAEGAFDGRAERVVRIFFV